MRAASAALAAVALAGCVSSGPRPYIPEKTLPGPVDAPPNDTPPGLAGRDRGGAIVVQRGDSLFAIARDRGVPLRGLIDANRLAPPYVIHPGQRLVLPRAHFHVVGDEDTIYGISQRYGVDMGALVRVNQIPPPYRIAPGQRLRLPQRLQPVSAVASAVPAPKPTLVGRAAPDSKQGLVSRTAPIAAIPPAPPPKAVPVAAPPRRAGQRFLWPLRGPVILGYGLRRGGLRNDGINIAAREGSAIRAAENGVVAYAGNQLQGFGNLILLKHADGWMTAYAHNSVLLVRRGEIVQRGQVIARVGKTGHVTRPQLHFELRKGDRAVNPTPYLIRFARAVGTVRTVAFRAAPRDPG